ncbi:UNVERIFIED_CONTAM: hypothetical protein Sradi_0862300 [Sesamum radiatum]|uniref:Zinc knuckle CX2CX4HX4C domain-containing protein n=1 Tax=Sesamum radiatum TaxID=300843 RepID=A0AAW2V2L8_SESRA
MEANDDPDLVDLNFCDFHIYIHGLLLRKITKDCASHIGNKLGKVKDVELDSNGEVWRSSVCIRVAIDITKPLKRALKIRTVLGHDHLITFTYERLPNFYYFCGCLGHLSRQCELQLQESFQDPGANPPYGHWLRAVAPQSYRGCNGVSLSRDMVHSLRRLTFVLGSSLQFQPQPPLPHRASSIFDNFGSSSIDSVRPSTPSAFNLHSVTPLPTSSPSVPIFANDLNLAPIPLIDPLCHILPDTTQTSPPPILLNPPPQSAATSKLKRRFDLQGLGVPSKVGEWVRWVAIYWNIWGTETTKRTHTWQLLSQLHGQSHRAWLCVRDFNEILDQSEKMGGSPRPTWQIQNFQQDHLRWWSRTVLKVDKHRIQLLEGKLRNLLRGQVTPAVNEDTAKIRLEVEGIAA